MIVCRPRAKAYERLKQKIRNPIVKVLDNSLIGNQINYRCVQENGNSLSFAEFNYFPPTFSLYTCLFSIGIT